MLYKSTSVHFRALSEHNMKKIYFAGSIRGGRIIEYIQKSDTVLTEHVGNLALSKTEGPPDRDVAIYEQETAWLRESDLVIAECTTPSLGVGYELAYAEKCGKPVHIFYNKRRANLSAMISGNKYFLLHPYREEGEIYPIIDIILGHD